MSKSTYGGGTNVKASTLVIGDTIRDPRKKDRILIVESLDSNIFVRGYEKDNKDHFLFINPENIVCKVTKAETSTTEGV